MLSFGWKISCSTVLGLVLSVNLAAADTVRGTVDVIDGSTMVVDGKTVRLADIVVPKLGDQCVWRERTFDCGKLARAGLMDVTAGANVVCTSRNAETYRCKSDGYDLGFGMIHAGWAVPLADAPSHYHRKMDEARNRKRALWSARDVDGKPEFAMALNPNIASHSD